MLNHSKYSFCLFMVLLSFSTAIAQDTAMDKYRVLVEAISTKATVAFKAEIKVYENAVAKTSLIDQVQMDYRKLGKQLYVRQDQIELFKNKSNYLHIDNETKTIHQLQSSQEGSTFPGLEVHQLEALVKLLSLEGRLYKTADGLDGICFAATGKSATKFEVVYDATSNCILETTTIIDLSSDGELTHPLNGKKVAISFSDYQFKDVALPSKLVDINRHISHNGKNQSTYNGYQIIR